MDQNVFDDPRITAIGLLFEATAGLSARFAAQFEDVTHACGQCGTELVRTVQRDSVTTKAA